MVTKRRICVRNDVGTKRREYETTLTPLHGMGNYRIVPWLTKKFYVPHNVWLTKDIDQRDKLFHEFCAYKKTTKPKIVSSSDGKLKVPNVPRLAKKPGQRTRARAERAKPKQF